MDPVLSARILVVDDEAPIRELLATLLTGEGCDVRTADSAAAGRLLLAEHPFDVVFTDLQMPGGSGIEILRFIREQGLSTECIVLTGYGSLDSAVQALRYRAFDYITKPCHAREIIGLARQAVAFRRKGLARPGIVAAAPLQPLKPKRARKLVGKSARMNELNELIERVAASPSTVLIRGESGTGKELVARALHDLSPRADFPMVPVNCGAIPEDLLESELFGHVRGAFTGAVADRPGRFVLADHGSIFLDEIGDMSPKLQVKVLRVLQEQELEPVGSTETIRVNTRVLAATHVDLEKAVAEKRFREDLYYRLNVIPVEVPPLRERISDLPLLIRHFIGIFNKRQTRQLEAFSPEAMDILGRFSWPGNVRELENLVERMSILARGSVVTPDDLPLKFRQPLSCPLSAPGARAASASPSGEAAPAPPLPPPPPPSRSFPDRFAPAAPAEDDGLSCEEQDWIRRPLQAAAGELGEADPDSERACAPVAEWSPVVSEAGVNLTGLVDGFERRLIQQALDQTHGIKSRAAEMLGIKRTTLVEKMKKKNMLAGK